MAQNSLDNEAYILEAFDRLFDTIRNPMITIMERIWFRNILYYIGEQWIQWSARSDRIQRKYGEQAGPTPPTPVSNEIRDHVRAMKAMILGKKFAVSIWPDSNEQVDRDGAKMGEELLRNMDLEMDEAFAEQRERRCVIHCLTGNGFDRTYPYLIDGDRWGLEKDGTPIKRGMVRSDSILPFNVRFPIWSDHMEDMPYIGVQGLKLREWVEDSFSVSIPSADTEGSGGHAISYQQRLMKLVSSISPWKATGLEGDILESSLEDLTLFREVEFAPCKRFPNGRYVIRAGNKIIKEYPRTLIPRDEKSKRWFYSLTHFPYHHVPGRFLADSSVDDMISPQNTINKIDQSLEMNRVGMGRPIIITPRDMKLVRKNKHGQAFIMLQYAGLVGTGAIQIYAGKPLPSQVLDERDIKRRVIQDVGGDPKNILRGQSPGAGASGIMVDILRETAEQSHQADVDRWYRNEKRVYRKRLILGAEVYSPEYLIKMRGKGKASKVEVKAFQLADLAGNTDVRLELVSGVSTTKAGQAQVLLKLSQQEWFAQLLANQSETRQEMLNSIGLSQFREKDSVDVKRAELENSILAQAKEDDIKVRELPWGDEDGAPVIVPYIEGIHAMAIGPPSEDEPDGQVVHVEYDPLFEFDNHFIHYEMIRRFILGREFTSLPPGVQAAAIHHGQLHLEMEKMEQQAQVEMQMAQQAQPGGPPGQQGGEMPLELPDIGVAPGDGQALGSVPGVV